MRRHQSGFGQLTSGRMGMGGQPLPHLDSARIVIGGKLEIHRLSS
jgi:hypothetical protein